MRRIVLPVTAIAVLPLVLAACGSTSTTSAKTSSAPLSPQVAVDAAYHTAGASPTSLHVDETVGIVVNSKNYRGSTISGDVYSDPSNPAATYVSVTENLSALNKSEGTMLMLLKNDKPYIKAGATAR
ncbi:hypothetical protein [Ferrimicrobium acidiphilum]|uniref:Uncharacterized protein n=1 Tax=Ferrimicrobium acidiphilum DSM 19497 TaxID=1121877 RepID=A0A0D8FTY0_9ACTN|nr:hypothetical protein [Ferrimicrobium acidiphilum]KJE75308.1 hypothetical protein FEAC_29690 [Ferrimicrobium acidiphilum DSM 19497]KJE76414.1 hypothetical protein FEAC_17740 [Ferrimicrobium acidiphilum DSM 19497]